MNILGIIAIVVILLNVGILIMKGESIKAVLTGEATKGFVNLTVESTASLNFSTAFINWSAGQVDQGQNTANLTTYPVGQVINGNWSRAGTNITLVVENIGNSNLSIGFSSDHSGTNDPAATTFIGGSMGGGPLYQWNFTAGLEGACDNWHTGASPGELVDVNGTIGICDDFKFIEGNNTINISFHLVIPFDATTGAKGDNISATFSAA